MYTRGKLFLDRGRYCGRLEPRELGVHDAGRWAEQNLQASGKERWIFLSARTGMKLHSGLVQVRVGTSTSKVAKTSSGYVFGGNAVEWVELQW